MGSGKVRTEPSVHRASERIQRSWFRFARAFLEFVQVVAGLASSFSWWSSLSRTSTSLAFAISAVPRFMDVFGSCTCCAACLEPVRGVWDSHGLADKCSALAAAAAAHSGVPRPSVCMCHNSLQSSRSQALCKMERGYVAAQGRRMLFASFGNSQLTATEAGREMVTARIRIDCRRAALLLFSMQAIGAWIPVRSSLLRV